MGYTRQLGQLAYLITYDGSGNITIPAAITQGSVTSSMLKTDGSGKLVAAVAGTDFVAPSSLSSYVPYTGATTNVNLGGYSLTGYTVNGNAGIKIEGYSGEGGYLAFKQYAVNNLQGYGYTSISANSTNILSFYFGQSTQYNGKQFKIDVSNLTNDTWRTYLMPDKDGTLALTSDISTAVSNLVASAPSTLDTLNELAAALGNDANFATTVATSIGTKVPSTRTITINGTSYDLSADRSWTIVSGVSSFNTRTGAITLTSGDVTGALGYTPVTNARTITINGTTYDLSADRSWSIVAGLSSFNTRTGAITLLDTDVTGALGYTPVTNARTITINGTTYDLSVDRTWVVDTSSVTTRVIQKFTATSSQTTFTITGGYTVGMVDVFLNGIKLDNATEFTASNGSTVVLAVGAATGDIVEVYKYGGQFIANNTLRQSTLFTATAGQTTFTVNYSVGFVDVFYNGSKLDSSEFTATNGTSIILGTACVLNDKIEVIAYNYTVGAFTGVGGSGTASYVPKWTASGTLGNSLIQDNGTTLSVGGQTTFTGAYSNTSDVAIIASASIPGINLRTPSSGRFTIATNYVSSDTTSFLVGTGANTPSTSTIFINHSTGNVAIGGTSANAKLHITETATDSGLAAIFQRNIDAVGEYVHIQVGNTSYPAYFGSMLATYDTGYMSMSSTPSDGKGIYVNTAGDVLIGSTTYNNNKFEIRTSTYNRIASYFSGAYTSGFKFSDLYGGIIYDAAVDTMTLSAYRTFIFTTNNGTQRGKITNSGSLLMNGHIYSTYTQYMQTTNGGAQTVRVLEDCFGRWLVVGKFAANAADSITGTWSSVRGLSTSTSQSDTTAFSADFGDAFPTEVRVLGSTDFDNWRDTRTIDFIYKVPAGRQWKTFFNGGATDGTTVVTGVARYGFTTAGTYDGLGRWNNPENTQIGMSDGAYTNPSTAYTTPTANAFNWNTTQDAKLTAIHSGVYSGQDANETVGFGVDDNIKGFFDSYNAVTSNMQTGVVYSSAVWILIKLN